MVEVTSSGTARVTLPTDEQILITREFDAPKHLVYEAWTTPELVKRWWNAKRGEVTVCEIDLRVGGTWRYVMVADGGFEVGFHGEYREIVPDERIVSTETYEGLPEGVTEEQGTTVNTATFTEDGRAHNPHASRAGAEQGDPRRDHRVGDGGRPAGCAGSPRGGRGLSSLSSAVGSPAAAGLQLERGEKLRPVLHRVPDRERRGLAEAADRGLLHREQPLVHLLAGHGRAAVLELLAEMVQGAVSDPAGRALLARLLGEEAHRLGEEPERRVALREDLDRRRARLRRRTRGARLA